MRLIAIAIFSALMLTPAAAEIREVQNIKARGANAAGVCAGALDMIGQYLDRADNRDIARLQEVQRGRDFFADLPQYPSSEIAAAANAFVTFMSGRLVNAQTTEERQAVQRELLQLATGCIQSARPPAPPPGGAVAPPPATVLPTEPLITQPYEVQPLPVQPYETQPLILDPVVPAQ